MYEHYAHVSAIPIHRQSTDCLINNISQNVGRCRDGSVKNHRSIGMEIAQCRQDVAYKDYTSNPILTSLFSIYHPFSGSTM